MGLTFDLQGRPPAFEPGDQPLIEAHEGIQSQAVPEFPGAQAPAGPGPGVPASLQLLQQILQVNENGNGRHIDITLEDAVAAIHGAVERHLQHLVAAAEVIPGPGTGAPERSLLHRQQQGSLGLREPAGPFMLRGPQEPAILDDRHRQVAQPRQDAPGHRVIPDPFLQPNPADAPEHGTASKKSPRVRTKPWRRENGRGWVSPSPGRLGFFKMVYRDLDLAAWPRFSLMTECAAAMRAMGMRIGEHDT